MASRYRLLHSLTNLRVRGYFGSSFLIRQAHTNTCSSKQNFVTSPVHSSIKFCANNSLVKSASRQNFSTSAEAKVEDATDKSAQTRSHNIIRDDESSVGETTKFEFQAETKKLLDIVARSLYSDQEIFVRELISNASDALEKLRYIRTASLISGATSTKQQPLEIHLATKREDRVIVIQDTGVGMTREEVIENLGTIAKSGSRAFIHELEKQNQSSIDKDIIGQFGVGFYSAFMVADKIEVFTKSHKASSPAVKWISSGTGEYEISEAESVQPGSKIILHLKPTCADFSNEDTLKKIIEKYSNFVGAPIYLNGTQINTLKAVWLEEPRKVTPEEHDKFFQFISKNAYDHPRYTIHYRADAPLSIRALLYVPQQKPSLLDYAGSSGDDVGVSLYSRKVLILPKAKVLLPEWLRFMKGVVDSEDIPLNLSREMLQDHALIRKLRLVIASRVVRFLADQSKKDPEKYNEFIKDFRIYMAQGIATTPEQQQKEDIAKLLRFESSSLREGKTTSLEEYVSRMKAGHRSIYFLSAPSRSLAEASPYFESIKEQGHEVLFCYENFEEVMLLSLGQFDRNDLVSAESALHSRQLESGAEEKDSAKAKEAEKDHDADQLSEEATKKLTTFLTSTLEGRASKVQTTSRASKHPCVVTAANMANARHFLRSHMGGSTEAEKLALLQPVLEVNTRHPLIMELSKLQSEEPSLAKLLAEQLFDNALVTAGLVDDPRTSLSRINELLTLSLQRRRGK